MERLRTLLLPVQTALTLSERQHELPALSPGLVAESGFSSRQCLVIVSAIDGQNIGAAIRDDFTPAAFALALELESCAKVYTGASKTDEAVWDELCDFVIRMFPMLGFGEIRFAFQSAAAGELGDINLRSYFGTFTVAMLGEILSAYLGLRQTFVRRVLFAERADFRLEIQAARHDLHDSGKWEAARREQLLALLNPDVFSVTAKDYEWLERAGYIQLTPAEKWTLWANAHDLVLAEFQIEKMRDLNRRHEIDGIVARVTAGETDAGFNARKTVLSQRLAVVDWIKSMRPSETDPETVVETV